jgi:hypothetical protein
VEEISGSSLLRVASNGRRVTPLASTAGYGFSRTTFLGDMQPPGGYAKEALLLRYGMLPLHRPKWSHPWKLRDGGEGARLDGFSKILLGSSVQIVRIGL